MARETVVVEGLDELIRNLDKLTEVVKGKAMTGALLDGAEVIQREAKLRAPVLKGEETPRRRRGVLRSSITRFPLAWNHVIVRVRNQGAPRFASTSGRAQRRAANPNNAWWWWHVEFGTRHAPAQPFLRPAFEAKKREAVYIIRQSLKHPIETAARHMQKRRRRR